MTKRFYSICIGIVFCWFVYSASIFAQSKKFFHLSSKDGLSQNNVYAICEDYRGFIWIGTRDGLNKYDGYNITVYKHDPLDSTTISNNFIRVIFSDSKNRLWIGSSDGGLNLYNFEHNKFTQYTNDKNSNKYIPGNNIGNIQEDSEGNLWVGTIDAGLFMFNPDKNIIKSYQHSDTTKNAISNNSVRALSIDKEGFVWIGFWGPGGLNRIDPKTSQVTKYTTSNSGLSSNYVREIHIDSDNILWIGTDGGGMNKFNPRTQVFEKFQHEKQISGSLSHNVVSRIIEGFDGEIWIGTENGGLSIFNPKTKKFLNYLNTPSDATSISNNSIYALYKTENTIWIGSYSGGVDVYFKENNLFSHSKYDILNKNSLSNNSVLCFTEDDDGNIWIGTDGGGLNKFDPKTGKYSHIRNIAGKANSLSSDHIVDLLYTSDKKIWVGTWGGGISIYDPLKNTFSQAYRKISDEIKSKYKNSWCLVEDSKGLVWVGTYYGGLLAINKQGEIIHRFETQTDGSYISQNDIAFLTLDPSEKYLWIGTDADGLNRLDLSDFTFTYFKNNPKNPNSLINNNIVCMVFDSDNLLWIGTSNGLSCLNTTSGNFRNYTVENGLASDFITGIVEDSDKNLWLSTKKGVSRLKTETGNIINFDIHQGLQDYEFNRGAFLQTKKGHILFGGIMGYNIFNPKEIIDNDPAPPIYLTAFYLHNTPSELHGIATHPNELKEIKLKYKQNYLTFEYAALAFDISSKIEYKYKLTGVDPGWVLAQKKRSATYTNIKPGKYEFWVCTVYNNVEQEPVKLISITIIPPFWKRPVFIASLIVLLLIIGLLFIQYRERRLVQAKRKLEILVAERTNSIEKQKTELELLNKTKDKLFSIIAHDLRNPFNIILGFTELMYNRIGNWDEKKITETIGMINASARRIYNLLENLLAWANSQNANFTFKPVVFKLLPLAEDSLDLFSTLLVSKNLLAECTIDKDLEIKADVEMLRTIFRNLISNAIKFSRYNGMIKISASRLNNSIVIEVVDNGVGIPEDRAEILFSNTFETTVGTDNEKGTGLGLYICHEFMEKHKGKIYYKSTCDVGTTFFLEFPVE